MRTFGGIAKDTSCEIHGQEFRAGWITKHGHQRLIDIQELAFRVAATHSIVQVSYKSAVARL